MNRTIRHALPDVPQTRQYVRDWLERTEQARRMLTTASVSDVDHTNVTSILDVYGKAKAACQEARIEPLTGEERAACEEITRNLQCIRDAADSMSERAERLRSAAARALHQRKA